MRRILSIACTLAFALTATLGHAVPPQAREPVAPLDLDALHGKVVVLENMQTWCGACQSAIPTLNRWHQRFADRGLYVVAATPEAADALERYRDSHDLDAHAAVDVDGAAARRFEVTALPTFVVLDRDGTVRARIKGAGDALDDVEAAFTKLLDAPGDPDGIRF